MANSSHKEVRKLTLPINSLREEGAVGLHFFFCIKPQRFICLSISLRQQIAEIPEDSICNNLNGNAACVNPHLLHSRQHVWNMMSFPTPCIPLSVCAFRKPFWCQQFSFWALKQYDEMMLRASCGRSCGSEHQWSLSLRLVCSDCPAAVPHFLDGVLEPRLWFCCALINLINIRFDSSHQEMLATQMQKFWLYFLGYDTDFNLFCSLEKFCKNFSNWYN